MKPTAKLRRICKNGALVTYANFYVETCKRGFPNLAGFARSLGVGLADLERIAGKHPEQYGAALALLEDEALNCGKSPTILSAYLKGRLDFGEKNEGGDATDAGAEMRIVFEHDIGEDGR